MLLPVFTVASICTSTGDPPRAAAATWTSEHRPPACDEQMYLHGMSQIPFMNTGTRLCTRKLPSNSAQCGGGARPVIMSTIGRLKPTTTVTILPLQVRGTIASQLF